jgi:hypothetical protein
MDRGLESLSGKKIYRKLPRLKQAIRSVGNYRACSLFLASVHVSLSPIELSLAISGYRRLTPAAAFRICEFVKCGELASVGLDDGYWTELIPSIEPQEGAMVEVVEGATK